MPFLDLRAGYLALKAEIDAAIATLEVLEAAGSQWNFLPFRPGLVGGHGIGVDPTRFTLRASPTRPSPSATTPRSSSPAGASTTGRIPRIRGLH
jgi:hypothetical protein